MRRPVEMKRRRIKPLKEAEDHVLRCIDKTDALEAKHINDYKGRFVNHFDVVVTDCD